MQVEGQHGISLLILMATGARVRNAYATHPPPGDSPGKSGLTPHEERTRHLVRFKTTVAADGHACH